MSLISHEYIRLDAFKLAILLMASLTPYLGFVDDMDMRSKTRANRRAKRIERIA